LYLRDSAWLSTFGTVIAVVSNSFGQRDHEWIAFYAAGVKLDVAFLSIESADRFVFEYPQAAKRGEN
jgi:hypothetical protein